MSQISDCSTEQELYSNRSRLNSKEASPTTYWADDTPISGTNNPEEYSDEIASAKRFYDEHDGIQDFHWKSVPLKKFEKLKTKVKSSKQKILLCLMFIVCLASFWVNQTSETLRWITSENEDYFIWLQYCHNCNIKEIY